MLARNATSWLALPLWGGMGEAFLSLFFITFARIMTQTSPIQELLKQKMLLQMEYYSEKEAFRKQTEAMGLQRKVKRGDAWFPLQIGKSYYNSLNQMAIEVTRTSDQEIEHNFEFGRPVVFFKIKQKAPSLSGRAGGEVLSYFSFTGTVSYVDGDRMVVVIPDGGYALELQSCETKIGCQLFFDETSYKLMFEALDRVTKVKGTSRLGITTTIRSPST